MSEEAPVTEDEIKARVREAALFLEKMMGVHIPRNVEEAMNPEWIILCAKVGEGIVEHVSEKELKEARKRVIPIARANEILRSIESRAVHLFVQAPTSEIVRALIAPFSWITYFVENEGKILLLLAELAGYVSAVVRGEFLEKSIEQWEIRDKQLMNFDFGGFWRQLASQNAINEKLISDVIAATAETVERALSEMAWENIGPMIVAFAAGAALIKAFKPLTESRTQALKAISKAPLPQRSTGRWRRRKRSRKD